MNTLIADEIRARMAADGKPCPTSFESDLLLALYGKHLRVRLELGAA